MKPLDIAWALCISAGCCVASADEPYAPPSPEAVPNYSATLLPCEIRPASADDGLPIRVACKGDLLEGKSLRDLSILRNTIYARYGWDGFRKEWLRNYFHAQPWFRPNPKFTYKLLTDADRKNAHFIGVREQQFTESQLLEMRDDVYARRGKVWHDQYVYVTKSGKKVRACEPPPGADEAEEDAPPSRSCRYAGKPWYRPDPAFSEDKLSADDRIELGLLDRALGHFALDDKTRSASEQSLDRILSPAELRKLSLRDLRLLRNTIYARRGRPFKSEILQKHFQGMSWYKKDPQYSDTLLSKTDVRNIALIKSVENEFGGPMTDEDWLIEPAIDAA